jgi:Fe-S oxidoreductase
LIKNKVLEIVTYQDSCYSRFLDNFEEIRKILNLIGYEIKEMPDSKEETVCCGNCGQLGFINPTFSDSIARERILQAKRINVRKIITSSISDYEILNKNSNNEIEVVDISEVLAYALGIKKKESQFKEFVEEEEILDKIDKDLENKEIAELIGE